MCKLVALLLVVPGAAMVAAERCPWMNAATAGGLLGGEVSVQVTRPNPDSEDASCIFDLRRAGAAWRLNIDVATGRGRGATCSPGTPLKAIGNEAVLCTESSGGERRARVVGRTRDRTFVVVVSTNERSAAEEALREKARSAAEQVAGTLF